MSEIERRVLFVAHPVAGDVVGNIANAKRWLRWLMLSEPALCFVAPWLTAIDAGANDANPAERERGLLDNEAVLERCDGLVMVGGRVSSGMERERQLCVQLDMDVDDLTFLGWEVPPRTVDRVLSRSIFDIPRAAGISEPLDWRAVRGELGPPPPLTRRGRRPGRL